MNTYREIAYMCLDQLKSVSDDAYYTTDHIMYLMDKGRAFLLKKYYSDIKKEIPRNNYQTLVIPSIHLANINSQGEINITGVTHSNVQFLIKGAAIQNEALIPNLLEITKPFVYCSTYSLGELTYTTPERFQFIGTNKWLKNIIYCTIKDNTLYLKAGDTDSFFIITRGTGGAPDVYTQNINSISVTGIFENPREVYEYMGLNTNTTYPLDSEFPIEENLIPEVIEYVVKSLIGAQYRPKDQQNNATDDLSNLEAFIRRNLKSDVAKQIEGA